MPRYVVLEKAVGETPLAVIQRYKRAHPEYVDTPMTYAGRLDPMASGKLLILIGDECKHQETYRKLDKAYQFEVLFGVGSDTGDVLGLLSFGNAPKVVRTNLRSITQRYSGRRISLPYPKFSARTVAGKPLHVWTLEGRLNEIEIPNAHTTIHRLALVDLAERRVDDLYDAAIAKITSLPPVVEPTKALGEDFRREKVLADWASFKDECAGERFAVATFLCIASSGTYMRSVAAHIGEALGTPALAFSIHRTRIGRYRRLPFGFGLWSSTYQ